MDTATAILGSTLISCLFGAIMLQLMTRNWFKKERFKIDALHVKKINDLEIKKKMRELGFSSSSQSPPATQGTNIGSLLEIAKNLNPEQLGAISDIIQGRIAGGEGEGELLPEGVGGLLEFIDKNPDIVDHFTKGFLKKNEESTAAPDGWLGG